MKNRYLPYLVLLLFSFNLQAQDNLQVLDPDDWWWPFGESGKIEEATISLEPKGLYTEVGLYLTISDEGLFYPEGMELEIALDFNLPAGSIIHDSWLWMPDEDIIVQAEVYDISTAIQTYEDIVDRNRDPSILYKKGASNYQIRIFPLFAGESRKIKITYLSPNNWDSESISSWIPTGILSSGIEPLENIRVIHIPHSDWVNPRLEGVENINFTSTTDPVFGEIAIANLSGDQLDQPITYVVDAPFSDENYYIGKWGAANDQFYQLAYLPPAIQNPAADKHLLFLLENQANNSNVQASQIKQALMENLMTYPEANNKFNLGYEENGQVKFLQEDWIELTATTVQESFENLPNTFATNTVGLLEEGIAKVQNLDEPADIILISNAHEFDHWLSANVMQNVIQNLDGAAHRIHVLDYQNQGFEIIENWPDPVFIGTHHHEFYRLITNWTKGRLISISDGSLNIWQMLDDFANEISFENSTYDLHTKLQQGLTFDRHDINRNKNIGPDQPLLQIGKYNGEFPMEIEFSAIDGQDFIYEETWINESHALSNDSLNREMWVGNEIKFMEGNINTNSDIQSIVDMSISERVLSKHTAFLALDLENGGEICANCWEVGGEVFPVSVDELDQENVTIAASPNPFSAFTTITISVGDDESLGEVSEMALYDSFGKLIKRYDHSLLTQQQAEYKFIWDGTAGDGTKLPGGIYHFILTTNTQSYSVKLALIEY